MRDRQAQIDEAPDDIAIWGERLMAHLAGVGEAEFARNVLVQDAACRCIMVLGEAARRLMDLDPGMADRHPDLALREAYGARNRIAHGYDVVDYAIVWAAARQAIPRMVAAARAVLDH